MKGSSSRGSAAGSKLKKKKGSAGVGSSSDNYSSYRYDESESLAASGGLQPKIGQAKGKPVTQVKSKANDYMRESYQSSSLSTDKPGVALFAK